MLGSENILFNFCNFDALMTDSLFLSILAHNDEGKSAYKIPVFVYKGVQDEISPISETDESL